MWGRTSVRKRKLKQIHPKLARRSRGPITHTQKKSNSEKEGQINTWWLDLRTTHSRSHTLRKSSVFENDILVVSKQSALSNKLPRYYNNEGAPNHPICDVHSNKHSQNVEKFVLYLCPETVATFD